MKSVVGLFPHSAEMFTKLCSHKLKNSEIDFVFRHSWLPPKLLDFDARQRLVVKNIRCKLTSKCKGVIRQSEMCTKRGSRKQGKKNV